jgi:hypothetical protein
MMAVVVVLLIVISMAHLLLIVLALAVLMAVGVDGRFEIGLLLFLILEALCFGEGVGCFGRGVVEDVVHVGAVAVYEFAHLGFIRADNITNHN